MTIVSIAAYGYAALSSIGYEYPLEWMEGGTLDLVRRIHTGQPIYCAPSLEYIPYIYTPLYYHAVAAVTAADSWDFLPGRLIGLVGTLGIAALIGCELRRRRCDWSFVIVGVGLFFATYSLSGRWFHVARVDTLFLFLLLFGLLLYQWSRSWPGLVASGVILTLAFLTKQSALLAIAVFLPLSFFRNRRRAVSLAAIVGIGVAAVCGIWQLRSDGWFFTYVFDLPRGHALLPKMATRFFTREMLLHLPVLGAFAAFGVWRTMRRPSSGAIDSLATFASLGATSFASRIHEGGYMNVLMPVHVGLVLFAVPHIERLARVSRPWSMRVVPLVLIAQFMLLAYDPRTGLPSSDDRRAGREFLDRVEQLPGSVLVPCHRALQGRVGKKSYGFGMAGIDVLRSESCPDVRDRFERELLRRVENQEFSAIILPDQTWVFPNISQSYEHAENLFDGEDYVPMTGAAIRPQQLWVPRVSAARDRR